MVSSNASPSASGASVSRLRTGSGRGVGSERESMTGSRLMHRSARASGSGSSDEGIRPRIVTIFAAIGDNAMSAAVQSALWARALA
jgi:hypothetical protein